MIATKLRRYKPGDLVGSWTILAYVPTGQYSCRCACGAEQVVPTGNLAAGKSKRCMACSHKAVAEKTRKHRVGDVIRGRMIVAEQKCDSGGRALKARCLKCGAVARIIPTRPYRCGVCYDGGPPPHTKSVTLTIDGKPLTLTMTEWHKRAGITRQAYFLWLKHGWTQAQALTVPKGAANPQKES